MSLPVAVLLVVMAAEPAPATPDTGTLLAEALACDAGLGDPEASEAWWHRMSSCRAHLVALRGRSDVAGGEVTLWSLHDTLQHPALKADAMSLLLAARLHEASLDETPVADTPDAALVPLVPTPSPAEDDPEWLATAPADLAAAYHTATGSASDYWAALEALSSSGQRPGYFEHRAAFDREIEAYARGHTPAREAVRRIGRFIYDGGCGNGAGMFTEPRDQALLLAFMELGERRLALGALQSLMGAYGHDEGSGDDGLKARLAARLGADWETLAIGELLQGSTSGVDEVARRGSDRGAGLLLASLDLPRYEDEEIRIGDDASVLAAVAALVAPGSSCPGPVSVSSVDLTREAPELPASVQVEALESLHARTGVESGLETAGEAARQLRRLCRPESLAAFEAMAESPYAAVRRPGREALAALGHAIEDDAERPVLLRLTVDGQPWTRPLAVQLARGSMDTTVEATPDDHGLVRLERDVFVDPRYPVEALSLGYEDDAEGGGTWFAVELEAPLALDATTAVAVSTLPVAVRYAPRAAGECGAGACTVTILSDAGPGEFGDRLAFRNLRPGETWSLRLQSGRLYRALVHHEALGSWASPVLELGSRPGTLEVRGDTLRSTRALVAEMMANEAAEGGE